MQEGAFAGEIRAAVEELQAYLSDLVPPLLVSDSVELLLGQPPELGADAVLAWVAGQGRRRDATRPTGDYLFHAIKKINLLGDLRLVPAEPLETYVDGLIQALVGRAPAAERQALETHLRRASEFVGLAAPAAGLLHLETPGLPGVRPGAGADPSFTPEMARHMRSFAALLSRLGGVRASGEGADKSGAARAELAPQLLVAAAQSARSQHEFEQYLASLSKSGLMTEVRMSDLFSTLSRGMADWWVGGEGDESGVPAYESAPVQAMRRIVSLVEDPAKTASHFRELLKAAAQQFNSGSLGRAVQVLDVARRLLAEKKIERASADLILGTAHDDLDSAALLAQSKEPGSFPQLRRLLGFYPALQPEGLLLALDNEPDRLRRRLLLALVEVHGEAGRRAALDRLEASFGSGEQPANLPWLQRNFLYLLHRIPPAPTDDLQREVALSARSADLRNPAPLVREALINLGLRRHPDAEAALRQRLAQLERSLELPQTALHDPAELVRMLGMVISGLARFGTSSARRAVAEHGLKQKPQLGDTLARLGELGAVDLAADPELVDRLLESLRQQLPMRVLGMSLRRTEAPLHLVRALQGTRSDAVQRSFSDIAARFPGEPFGQLAASVLGSWQTVPAAATEAATTAAAPAVSLAGDLEVFGMPELLQTLMQTQASGRLLLRSRHGEPVGELTLREGGLASARVGRLELPDAFYQLLEEPQPGTFEFTRQPVEAATAGAARDLMGLLMEGMRRYDELARARALAPDHAYLFPTGRRPTPPPEERDGVFIRDLWTRVKTGATPRQCEQAVNSDAYRVRALLGHWLTEGAVEIRQAPENAPP